MSQLAVMLQEPDPGGRRSTTILGLLRRGEKMDDLDRRRRKKSLKERLGLKGMGCCGGPIWGFRTTTISVRDDDEGDTEIHHQLPEEQLPPRNSDDPTGLSGPEPLQDTIDRVLDPGCGVSEAQPAGSAMNLAAALAAERQYRASHEPEGDANGTGPRSELNGRFTELGTPLRVSLMRLLEEADSGGDGEGADGGDGGGVGSDTMCCVCMGRKKGAAFIPCGHTYCRVCSRELWLNRGSCPLCNRPILEILDIF